MEGNEKKDFTRQSLHYNQKAQCLVLIGTHLQPHLLMIILCFAHVQLYRDNHVFVNFPRSKSIPFTMIEFLSLLIPQFPISVSMKLSYGDFISIQTHPFKNNNLFVYPLITLYMDTMCFDHIHPHYYVLTPSRFPHYVSLLTEYH